MKSPSKRVLRGNGLQGTSVLVAEGDQIKEAEYSRSKSCDEEEAPEAFKIEIVGREGAAFVWAVGLIPEPLPFDLHHLITLCNVKDRPREIRN